MHSDGSPKNMLALLGIKPVMLAHTDYPLLYNINITDRLVGWLAELVETIIMTVPTISKETWYNFQRNSHKFFYMQNCKEGSLKLELYSLSIDMEQTWKTKHRTFGSIGYMSPLNDRWEMEGRKS